jgi:uncharacterized repeat protein (TIGR03803 family)
MSYVRNYGSSGADGVISNFDAEGDWIGDTGLSTAPDAVPFSTGGGFGNVTSAAGIEATKGPKLTSLVSFNGADGALPFSSLITNAAGDLIGTTYEGGAHNYGTVFEIATTEGGYAKKPNTLVSFNGADGQNPKGSLITDAAGDLIGTTYAGGADYGTVFEIAMTEGGYVKKPTTLASFDGIAWANPCGSLITDAAGDLFGTTNDGGAYGPGAVFEIAKTKHGYAKSPTTIASFNGGDGQNPQGSLIADAAGDLFGTTALGGADNGGTVFEIVKTEGGYASAPTTLASFSQGLGPGHSSLIIDAAGDLFGTTAQGGAGGGTVFEIVKTEGGYASAPTILVSFTGADGANPYGSLIIDAAGDLFGTTYQGGAGGGGTVFEIAKTQGGYASAPTTLVSFNGADGQYPVGSLIADAAGDLFGTTEYGGTDSDGTVFEITNSGFVSPTAPAAHAGADITHPSPSAAAFVQAMASHGASWLGSGGPEVLASRNDMPMLLSRPHAAF